MSVALYILGALGLGGGALALASSGSSSSTRTRPRPARAAASDVRWRSMEPPAVPPPTGADFRTAGPPAEQWAELVGGAIPNTVGERVGLTGIQVPPGITNVRIDVRLECRVNCRGSGESAAVGYYDLPDGRHPALHIPGMAVTYHIGMRRGAAGWTVDYVTPNPWVAERVTSEGRMRIAPLHLADALVLDVVPNGANGVAIGVTRTRRLPDGNKRPIYRWDVLAWEVPT